MRHHAKTNLLAFFSTLTTLLLVFISTIVGVVLGYAPGLFLAALMQGQGTETVGIVAYCMAIGGGMILPLRVFRGRMDKLPYRDVATGLLATFIGIGLFLLRDPLVNLIRTNEGLGTLFDALFLPALGATLITLGMTAFGVKRIQ